MYKIAKKSITLVLLMIIKYQQLQPEWGLIIVKLSLEQADSDYFLHSKEQKAK